MGRRLRRPVAMLPCALLVGGCRVQGGFLLQEGAAISDTESARKLLLAQPRSHPLRKRRQGSSGGTTSGSSGDGGLPASRFVDSPCHPKTVQQHGELARECHFHSPPRLRVSFAQVRQGPALEVRLLAAAAEDVIRALHQQAAQIAVTALGDPQLRVALVRLALPGDEPEVGGDVPAASRGGPALTHLGYRVRAIGDWGARTRRAAVERSAERRDGRGGGPNTRQRFARRGVEPRYGNAGPAAMPTSP
jgi:hypothetical protein